MGKNEISSEPMREYDQALFFKCILSNQKQIMIAVEEIRVQVGCNKISEYGCISKAIETTNDVGRSLKWVDPESEF